MSASYGNPREGIGLAARVILHLSSLPRLGPNDIAHLDSTQQGMVSAFAVQQGSLVRVLQRLMAGEVISVERRFVGDVNRRMKVYRLTALGESAARDLRHPRSNGPPPPPPHTWVAEGVPTSRPGSEAERLGV
jgi:DNA-binding PadR family transcriptional regulator